MRVLVCGGRTYDNWRKVNALLDSLHKRYGITKIIQGAAQGADFLASTWAMRNGVPDTGVTYKPDWDTHGRSAGIRRNADMFNEEVPQLVIGFPGDRGTAHMTEYAAGMGCPTMIVPDIEWEEAHRSLFSDLDDALEDGIVISNGDDDEGATILHTEPYWLKEPGPKDKWTRKVAPLPATPANRYDADILF